MTVQKVEILYPAYPPVEYADRGWERVGHVTVVERTFSRQLYVIVCTHTQARMLGTGINVRGYLIQGPRRAQSRDNTELSRDDSHAYQKMGQ